MICIICSSKILWNIKKTLYNLPKETQSNGLKWFKYDFENQLLGQY